MVFFAESTTEENQLLGRWWRLHQQAASLSTLAWAPISCFGRESSWFVGRTSAIDSHAYVSMYVCMYVLR